MKAADNMNNRRMNLILCFFVVAVPYYLLDLQFYFSSKGTLLSSLVAATFGGVALTAAQGRPRWQPILSLSSPFLFVACFFLAHPAAKTVLLGLMFITLLTGLWTTQRAAVAIRSGGRSELSFLLKSAAETDLLNHFRSLFRAWSAAGLSAFVLHSLFASPWIPFILPAAIAIILSSVVNSTDAKESR